MVSLAWWCKLGIGQGWHGQPVHGEAGKFWLGMAAVGRAATGRAGGAWSAGYGGRRGRVRGVWQPWLGWDVLCMARRQGLAGLALFERVRLVESRRGR